MATKKLDPNREIQNGKRDEELSDVIEQAEGKLEHCPFCGSTDIEIENTHTPYYWAKCTQCEAEVSEVNYPSDRKGNHEGHVESINAVVKAWNTRVNV